MGLATAAMIGLGGVQMGTSILSGYAKNKEAKYNANLLESTSGVYDVQSALVEKNKQLDEYRANRQIAQVAGATRAAAAGKGITMSGSPMAILFDTYTQMEMDKRIASANYDIQKYNIGVEKTRTLSQAAAYRRAGKTAVFQGYTNAFTSALQTGSNYAMYAGKL